jgi:hypothetical protein
MPEILAGDNLRECSGTGYRTNVIRLRSSPSGYRTDRESQSGAPGIWQQHSSGLGETVDADLKSEELR